MKALVYHSPGRRSREEVPDPTIQEPTDVICRIDAAPSAAPIYTSSRATSPQ